MTAAFKDTPLSIKPYQMCELSCDYPDRGVMKERALTAALRDRGWCAEKSGDLLDEGSSTRLLFSRTELTAE